MKCFAQDADCSANFGAVELKRTVRADLLDALAAIETEEALEAADLPGLEKCPCVVVSDAWKLRSRRVASS